MMPGVRRFILEGMGSSVGGGMQTLSDRLYIEIDAGGVILLAAIALGAAFLIARRVRRRRPLS